MKLDKLPFSYGFPMVYGINCHKFPLSVVTMEGPLSWHRPSPKGSPRSRVSRQRPSTWSCARESLERRVERGTVRNGNIDGEVRMSFHEPIQNTNMGMYTMWYQDIYSQNVYLRNIVRWYNANTGLITPPEGRMYLENHPLIISNSEP